jgi:ornithine--oxo-acid transaminase
MSTDPDARDDYGPFTPGFIIIPYNDLKALENALKDPDVAGFLVEPIQGEAGVFVPDEGYLKKSYDFVNQKMYFSSPMKSRLELHVQVSYWHAIMKVFVLIYLSSGKHYREGFFLFLQYLLMMRSCLQSNRENMAQLSEVILWLQKLLLLHLKLLKMKSWQKMLNVWARYSVAEFSSIKSDMVELVRGKGLLNAVVIKPKNGKEAWDVCLAMKDKGLIAKPTHNHIIRFAPPLVITEKQLMEAIGLIKEAFKLFE